MKITRAMLAAVDACPEQRDKFGALWPDGCEPSLLSAMKAGRHGLDLDFFARHFLRLPARLAYEDAVNKAADVYRSDVVTAQGLLDEAWTKAASSFTKAASSFIAGQVACSEAYRIFSESTAPAKKAYVDAKAKALWAAWQQDNPVSTTADE